MKPFQRWLLAGVGLILLALALTAWSSPPWYVVKGLIGSALICLIVATCI